MAGGGVEGVGDLRATKGGLQKAPPTIFPPPPWTIVPAPSKQQTGLHGLFSFLIVVNVT